MEVDRILSELRDESRLVAEGMRGRWLSYLRTHEEHYRSVLRQIDQPPPLRILEIGSFPGHLTVALTCLGYDVTGVDLAPSRAAELWRRHGIAVHQVDIEQEPLPFEAESFDLVLFTEVLEHLRVNPLYALREMNRVIGRGGSCILSTPNLTAEMRIRFLLGYDYQGDPVREYGKLETVGHMGHVRLFSENEIRRMLESTGFEVQRCSFEGTVEKPKGVGKKLAATALEVLLPDRLFRKYIYVHCVRP